VEGKGAKFRLRPLSVLQPSQLYINREKLKDLQSRIDFTQPENIPPIPIKLLDGERVMTDGHTRAFAAYLAGLDLVPIFPDEDDLDWHAYRICVAWCQEKGVHQISDLQGRVIGSDAYEKLWLARCKRMQKRLREQRR